MKASWKWIIYRDCPRQDNPPRRVDGAEARVHTPLKESCAPKRYRLFGFLTLCCDADAPLALRATPFNLQRRAVRHPSQCSYVICDDCLPVALFLSTVVGKIQSGRRKAD